MSRNSFSEVCDILRPYLTKRATNSRPNPSIVEAQLGMLLYYISDEGRYRKVANAFGVSRGLVLLTVRKVAKLIVKYMGPDLIKLPSTEEEVSHLTETFYMIHGFLQCIGASTHVPIKQPRVDYTAYINRKGYTSLNIQAFCDANYCFMDVVIKWPEVSMDSRIFQNSKLMEKFRSGKIPTC